MPKLKVAYGSKEDITYGLNSGKIVPGSLILTDDTEEIFFRDLFGKVKSYKTKTLFNSREEALDWIEKYDCKGEIFSIRNDDTFDICFVDYDDNLISIFDANIANAASVQADFLVEDPSDPAYIKNKPESVPVSFVSGLEGTLNRKVEIASDIQPGSLMVASRDGNLECSGISITRLFEVIDSKTEISGNVTPGALAVVTESGKLECSGITPDVIVKSLDEVKQSLDSKLELPKDYVPGALIMSDEQGNLVSTKVSYEDLVVKKDLITGSITVSKQITVSDDVLVSIPEEVLPYPCINVYHNGMILAEGMHYKIAGNELVLLKDRTFDGDIFTFMGHGSVSTIGDGDYHTHYNKSILDSINQDRVDKWDKGSNSIDVFKVNNVEVPIVDRTVNITVPTKPSDIGASPSEHNHDHYVCKDRLFDEDGYIYPSLIPDKISKGLELGDTSDTAFRGDLGAIAYEHSQEDHAIPTAQENVIESIKIADQVLPVEEKTVSIPIGTDKSLGVVKSSSDINKVFIDIDGTMSINKIDISNLSAPEGEELILTSGNSN